LYISFGT